MKWFPRTCRRHWPKPRSRSISDDVVARCLLSEAIRLFKAAARSNDDIAAELTAAADNLDDDTPLVFMRP